MGRLRTGVVLALLATTSVAMAQPVDPYGAPAGADPVLAEQVAEHLVARAQELLDAKVYVDAKQLAVEALVQSPKGNAADRAKFIIKVVNQQLGITDDQAPPPVADPNANANPAPVDLTPIEDPTQRLEPRPIPPSPVQPAEGSVHDGHLAATVHSAVFAGLIGATLGAYADSNNPAGGAVLVGLATALGGGIYGPKLLRRWDEAQIRTVGSASIWGGMIGGLIADASMGANGGTVTARGVLLGTTVGSTIGVLGGVGIARTHPLTRGDVALVDTFAGIGTAGGLTLGMVMQPAQKEAYAVNAALGAAAGTVVGYIAGPQTNTPPARMLRVAGVAAAGGAAPFLLYAVIHDSQSTADERVTGLLSSAGLVAGAWLGFYLTRNFESGLDVPDGTRPADAPIALAGRSSNGAWQFGGVGVQPLAMRLAPQPGVALTVLGATF